MEIRHLYNESITAVAARRTWDEPGDSHALLRATVKYVRKNFPNSYVSFIGYANDTGGEEYVAHVTKL